MMLLLRRHPTAADDGGIIDTELLTRESSQKTVTVTDAVAVAVAVAPASDC